MNNMTEIIHFDTQDDGSVPEYVIVLGAVCCDSNVARSLHLCFHDPVVGFCTVSDRAIIHKVTHFKLTGIQI